MNIGIVVSRKSNLPACADAPRVRAASMQTRAIQFALVGLICLLPATVEAQIQYGHLGNWECETEFSPDTQFETIWRKSVGEGRSQVLVDGGKIYVHVGENENRKDKPALIRSRLLCLDRDTGDEIWKHISDTVEMLEGQETFSGAPVSPRSTPVLIDSAIVTITYTGIVECLEADSGKLRWKLDLVKDLGADPVQFGFSASPIVRDASKKQVIVAAAGSQAGLFCLNTTDGSTIWKGESNTFSYATPTIASFDGVDQIISVTRNEVLGIDALDGKTLWKHPLASQGLTNVPSPIVLDQGFVISGQGIKGTRRIDVVRNNGQWKTEERWFARNVQFFYSNWSRFENIILGCSDRLTMAFNAEDGSVLGKWRGFTDGNLVRAGGTLLLLDGKGSLNLLTPEFSGDTPGIVHHSKMKVLGKRCWTPPTVFDSGILIRGGEQLTMLKPCQNGDRTIPNQLKQPKRFELKAKSTSIGSQQVDYVRQIFETYQDKGAGAALKLYNKLRNRKPSPLLAADRIALYEAAKEQNLNDLAILILNHAVEDYPDSEELEKLQR